LAIEEDDLEVKKEEKSKGIFSFLTSLFKTKQKPKIKEEALEKDKHVKNLNNLLFKLGI